MPGKRGGNGGGTKKKVVLRRSGSGPSTLKKTPTYSTKPAPKSRSERQRGASKSLKDVKTAGFSPAGLVGNILDDIPKIGLGFGKMVGSGAAAFGQDLYEAPRYGDFKFDKFDKAFVDPLLVGLLDFGDMIVDQAPGDLSISHIEMGKDGQPVIKWGKSKTEDPNRLWKMAKEDPLITVAAFLPAVTVPAKVGSVGLLTKSILAANKGMSRAEAARWAVRESRLPGTAAFNGVGGGIPERVWKGAYSQSVAAPPWARTPVARSVQKVTQRISQTLDRFNQGEGPSLLGGRLSTSTRAANRQRKTWKQEINRLDAWANEAQRIIDQGISEVRIGLIPRSRPHLDQALLAVLEAPKSMSFRAAIQTKILDLRNILSQVDGATGGSPVKLGDLTYTGKDVVRLRNNIDLLEKALKDRKIDSVEFSQAVEASVQVSLKAEEIYRKWAADKGIPLDVLSRRRDAVVRRWVEQGLIEPDENGSRVSQVGKAREKLDAKIAELSAAVSSADDPAPLLDELQVLHDIRAGLLDPDEVLIPEARAFVPHKELDSSDTSGRMVPRQLGGNDVVGVPKEVMNAHKNRLRRYMKQAVEATRTSLTSNYRNRVRYEYTVKAREWLWEVGDELNPGDPIPNYPGGTVLVRDPHQKAVRLTAEQRKAAKEGGATYAERYAEVNPDEFTPTTLAETVQDWFWDTSKPRPAWLADEDIAAGTVRAVPYRVATALLGDAHIASNEMLLANVAGILNNASRAALIYTPDFGARYVVRNGIQNMILMSVTNPSAFRHVARNSKRGRGFHLNRDIDVETGAVQATMGLRELGPIVRDPKKSAAVKGEMLSRRFSNWAGQKLSVPADEVWRRAMWYGYAERMGVDVSDAQAVRAFLDSKDPATVAARRSISQWVREDMIDFDALPEKVKAWSGRYFFILPFKYGAAKWPFQWAANYPLRAGLLAALTMGQDISSEEINAIPGNRIGGQNIEWMNPFGPAAESVPQALAPVADLARGDYGAALADAAYGAGANLSPALRDIGVMAFNDYFDRGADALASIVPGMPDYRRLKRGGSFADQVRRALGFSTDMEMSPKRKQKMESEKKNLRAIVSKYGLPYDVSSQDEIDRAVEIVTWIQDADVRAETHKRDIYGKRVKLTPREKAVARVEALRIAFPYLKLPTTDQIASVTDEQAEWFLEHDLGASSRKIIAAVKRLDDEER